MIIEPVMTNPAETVTIEIDHQANLIILETDDIEIEKKTIAVMIKCIEPAVLHGHARGLFIRRKLQLLVKIVPQIFLKTRLDTITTSQMTNRKLLPNPLQWITRTIMITNMKQIEIKIVLIMMRTLTR
jgi:hypothetical protein